MREASRTFEPRAARSVALKVYGDLVIREGAEFRVQVSGEADLVDRAWAETRNGRLELGLGRDVVEWLSSGFAMLGNRPLRWELTVPDLERIEVAGRARLDVLGVRGPSLEVRVAGLADGSLLDLEVDRFVVDVAGRAELRAAGRCSVAEVRVSGSAEVDLSELEAKEAEIRVSGHAEVRTRVRDRLEVRITGYGHVEYEGDPTVDQRVSGGGGVRRRNVAAQNG